MKKKTFLLFFSISILCLVGFTSAEILGNGGITIAPGKITFFTGPSSDALEQRMVIMRDGKTGFSQPAPAAIVDIKGPTAPYPYNKSLRVVASGDSPLGDHVFIVGNLSTPYGLAFGGNGHHRGGLYAKNVDGVATGYIGLWARNKGSIFLDAGKVGVGIAQPTEALEVKGNVKLSGNIVSDGDICIGKCTNDLSVQSADQSMTNQDPLDGIAHDPALFESSVGDEKIPSEFLSYPNTSAENIPSPIPSPVVVETASPSSAVNPVSTDIGSALVPSLAPLSPEDSTSSPVPISSPVPTAAPIILPSSESIVVPEPSAQTIQESIPVVPPIESASQTTGDSTPQSITTPVDTAADQPTLSIPQ